MEKFELLKGIAAPLEMINVDTDMIIPKQFLKTIKRSGLGKNLFHELRYDIQGNIKNDFVLNWDPYKQASILHKAGVKFAFCYQGDMEAMGQRNLPFSAGTAVAHGLPYEEAVKALTLNTAEILGIDEHTGQIKAGMDATFFISKGDALDMMGNEVKHAFIKGQAIDLDNKQKVLNRKYRKKYGLEVK